jgi:tetratricopeptide (TPR) repeat protein
MAGFGEPDATSPYFNQYNKQAKVTLPPPDGGANFTIFDQIYLKSYDGPVKIFVSNVAFGDQPAPDAAPVNSQTPDSTPPPSQPAFVPAAPPAPTTEQIVNQLNSQANTEFINGNYDGAIADATKVTELDPNNFYAWGTLGDAKKAKNDWTGALAAYDKFMELKSDSPNAYSNRGYVKLIESDYDGAIADANKAIEPTQPLGMQTGEKAIGLARLRHMTNTIGYSPTILKSITIAGLQRRQRVMWIMP